jgi:hypothetical protein
MCPRCCWKNGVDFTAHYENGLLHALCTKSQFSNSMHVNAAAITSFPITRQAEVLMTTPCLHISANPAAVYNLKVDIYFLSLGKSRM